MFSQGLVYSAIRVALFSSHPEREPQTKEQRYSVKGAGEADGAALGGSQRDPSASPQLAF